MDHLGPAGLGLDHPLEGHRVALGHVGALDQDAVRVDEVTRVGGRAAAAERDPQTGDRGGVSYAGLVLDLDGPERGEQLLDQVVLFVVEGRPAQAGEPEGAPVDLVALDVLPVRLAGGHDPVGDHLHRHLQVQLLPLGAVGAAVLDLGLAQRGGDQVLGGGALGAEPAAADRAVGVTLDLDDLLVLDVDALAAADRAVRADRACDPVGLGGPRLQGRRPGRLGRLAEPEDVSLPELANDRPRSQPLSEARRTLLALCAGINVYPGETGRKQNKQSHFGGRSGDAAQQGPDPEDDQIGGQAAADHGRPQPGRQAGPAEDVVGDHAQERHQQHDRDPGDGGAPAEVVAAGQVPQGERGPGGVQDERQQIAVEGEQQLPGRGGEDRDPEHGWLLAGGRWLVGGAGRGTWARSTRAAWNTSTAGRTGAPAPPGSWAWGGGTGWSWVRLT